MLNADSERDVILKYKKMLNTEISLLEYSELISLENTIK